jgi:hypothetical protein
LLVEAAKAAGAAPGGRGEPARWGDAAFVRELFGHDGAGVTIEEAHLPFRAASPEAWFDEQEAHHPAWRAVRAVLASAPGRWAELRERSLAALRAGNEDGAGFLATSRYLLVRVDRPG